MKSSTQHYLSQCDITVIQNPYTSLFKEQTLSPPISPTIDTTALLPIATQHPDPSSSMRPENQFLNSPLYQTNPLMGNRTETEHNIINESLQICVEGIPENGAKSRVETQIKLHISLTTKDGMKAPYWSYIRIPDSLLARSKLKKSQQQKLLDGSAAAMVSDESKVLDLEARVVCESDETKKIKMCQGCVRRERKRAERKKDSKPSIYDINSALVDEAFERDRQRILLFNCEPLVNFTTVSATLPTRITCYCRHHNERIGFRIRFALRSDRGIIVATGESPPIMITDDHKSSKQRSPTDSSAKTTTSASTVSTIRKRRRANTTNTTRKTVKIEQNIDALTTHAATVSRQNSIYGSESEEDLSPTHSDTSLTQGCFSSSTTTSTPSVLGHYSVTSPLPTTGDEDSILNHPGDNSRSSSNSTSPRTPTNACIWQNIVTQNPYNQLQLPISDISNLHDSNSSSSRHSNNSHSYNSTLSRPILLQTTTHTGYDDPILARHQENHILSSSSHTATTISHHDSCAAPSVLTVNPLLYYSQQHYTPSPVTSPPLTTASAIVSPVHTSHALPTNTTTIPTLDRIEPSEGPATGGIEVTILGENFHQGLTLMFGNRAATNVRCDSNSIVCILPAAEHVGPVMVSFKEHPLMRASPVPPMFNYYESGRQDLLDLSMQIAGLKNDYSSSSSSSPSSSPSSSSCFQSTTHHLISSPHQSPTMDGTSAQDEDYYNKELQVLQLLSQHYFEHDYSVLSQTTKGGQNLLHLAAHLGMANLTHFLISKRAALVHAQDRNGLSPLHFALWSKATEVIESLMKAGASVALVSNIGTPLDIVNLLLDTYEYHEFERQIQDGNPYFAVAMTETKNPISWLPNIFVYSAAQYYQRNHITMTPCIDFYLNNPIMVQDNSSLLYHI